MPKVVHFEINADDVERAKNFYEQVFDWKIEKWEGPMDYWLIMTGEENAPGIDGGLGFEEEGFPKVVNTIDVENVDEVVKKIQENGGEIITIDAAETQRWITAIQPVFDNYIIETTNKGLNGQEILDYVKSRF